MAQALDRLLEALRQKGEERAATRLSAELRTLGADVVGRCTPSLARARPAAPGLAAAAAPPPPSPAPEAPGVPAPSPGDRLPTGFPALDAALGGGLCPDGLTELVGPPGSGLVSLALAATAAASRRGELVAWIDPGFAFDPEGAEQEGARLESFLWLRPANLAQALEAADMVLDGGGFPLLVLDLALTGDAPPRRPGGPAHAREGRVPASVWPRLARRLRERHAALLLLTSRPLAGALSRATLLLEPGSVRALGTSRLVASRRVRVEVRRNRAGPVGVRLELELGIAPPGLGPPDR